MTAMTAMAEDYTDNLQVTVTVLGIQGSPSNQETTITVNEKESGKYSFSITKFAFGGQEVGDIVLDDLDGVEENGIITMTVSDKKVKIQNPGSLGKTINNLGGVTLSMTATLSNSKKKLSADLAMKAMGQNIKAIFGSKGKDSNIVTTGISSPKEESTTTSTIYTIDGQQVGSMTSGNVYIVKTTDGKTKKVIKK